MALLAAPAANPNYFTWKIGDVVTSLHNALEFRGPPGRSGNAPMQQRPPSPDERGTASLIMGSYNARYMVARAS